MPYPRRKPLYRRTPLRTYQANQFKSLQPLVAGRSNGKYRSITTEYGGRIYHSGKEASYARTLDALKKAARPQDRVVRWEPQVSYDLIVEGKKVCAIVPDFRVYFADGRMEIHEVKSDGTKTHVWWVKKRLFEALFPHIPYVVIE